MSTNLDFMRAVAVLLVLGDHIINFAFPSLQWPKACGLCGVLIFFVHTSLVLMQSIERHGTQSGWPVRFYLRRFFRLYPLAILFVVLFLIFRVPRGPNFQFVHHSAGDILLNLTLLQNFANLRSIVGPMWSLPYEVQMYVVLPATFVLLRRDGRARLLKLAGLIVLALLLARLNYAFPVNIFEFVPCFMGGVLAYALAPRVRAWIPAALWPVGLAAIAGGWILVYLHHRDQRYEWILCLALGFAIPHFRQLKTVSITRPAFEIAKYSYSIYLVHDALIWTFFVRLHLNPYLAIVGFIASLVLAPVLLYNFVEQPFIRIGVHLTQSPPKSAAYELATGTA